MSIPWALTNNLWHDDIRRPPSDDWFWARTNREAQLLLLDAHDDGVRFDAISLDHDLGLHDADPDVPDADMQRGWDTENDGYDLVKWLVVRPWLIPNTITIHSWNPVGAQRMARLFQDYGYPVTVKPYLRPEDNY